jgi:hypothetical protein
MMKRFAAAGRVAIVMWGSDGAVKCRRVPR